MGFRLVPKSVILKDLERVMAVILRYSTESDRWGQLYSVRQSD